ncbi:MAG: ABC transporter permease [Culicoidibacterales bacterium]
MKESFLKTIWQKRKIIWSLSFNKFKNSYKGSALGVFWMFAKPITTILIFWVVFGIGFKTQPINGTPYILWLIPGIFAWNFLSELLINGANAIRGNAHIVKKVSFPVETLPLIETIASFLNHLIFIGLTVVIVALGYGITFKTIIGVMYMAFAAFALMFALSRLFSTLVAVSVDIFHLLTTMTQALFWMTPVTWAPNQFGPELVTLLKFNPFFYLVEGYREVFYGFSEITWLYTAYFWIFVALIYVIAHIVYKRIHKEFADVI